MIIISLKCLTFTHEFPFAYIEKRCYYYGDILLPFSARKFL